MRIHFVVIGCIAMCALSIGSSAQPRQHDEGSSHDVTLHDAALKSGGRLVRTAGSSIEGPSPKDIESIVRSSDVVVIGTVGKITPVLFMDGKEVRSVVDVQVNELFKGGPAKDVVVIVPGGEVKFGDGVVVQVQTPLSGVMVSHSYVFCLTYVNGRIPGIDTGDRMVYRPAAPVDSIMDVSGDTVVPLPSAGVSPLAKQFAHRPIVPFINELRARTASSR